jgi:hypothetical protein
MRPRRKTSRAERGSCSFFVFNKKTKQLRFDPKTPEETEAGILISTARLAVSPWTKLTFVIIRYLV